MGIFDWKHRAVILLIALLLFGSRRLRKFGGDLGESIKDFRRSKAAPLCNSKEIEQTASPHTQKES
jgi:sec-independent protein translocase protein TatA